MTQLFQTCRFRVAFDPRSDQETVADDFEQLARRFKLKYEPTDHWSERHFRALPAMKTRIENWLYSYGIAPETCVVVSIL